MTTHTTTNTDEQTRHALGENVALGAGNFLAWAVTTNPAPKDELIFLEQPCRPFFGGELHSFSLASLQKAAERYAAWYYDAGIRPKDPVGIYLDDGIEYLIHYVALTALGAIPVMTNGNLPANVAAAYFRHVGVEGLFLDANHRTKLAPFLTVADNYRFIVTDDDLRSDTQATTLPDWFPFAHQPGDPIMIAHSSGTTGVPKAVVLQHQPFFHGIRYRLQVSSTGNPERILSALPHSHNCAMAYLMVALLSGNHVYISSDHTGENLKRRIAEFAPTMVVAFPQSYVELTEVDLTNVEFRTVRFWFNGGDAAHEQHIRTLISLGAQPQGPFPGAIFVDGMGSSEMGFSLFRHAHHSRTDVYNRCVGVPVEWAEAAILGDDGQLLPPHTIGRLGVRAPSVTSGYWNNSGLTFRSQLSGYWLTGDLAYCDESGRYFHVDRVPDVVHTATGLIYTLATEELLLKSFAEFADCSVIGVPETNEFAAAVAFVRLRARTHDDEASLLVAVNEVLGERGWGHIAALRLVGASEIPLGTTGKVLKRVLRERHADLLVSTHRELNVSDARTPSSRGTRSMPA